MNASERPPLCHFKAFAVNNALRDLIPFAEACNVIKNNTLPWVFFKFFKLHKWYKIAQSVSYLHYSVLIASFINYLLVRQYQFFS